MKNIVKNIGEIDFFLIHIYERVIVYKLLDAILCNGLVRLVYSMWIGSLHKWYPFIYLSSTELLRALLDIPFMS